MVEVQTLAVLIELNGGLTIFRLNKNLWLNMIDHPVFGQKESKTKKNAFTHLSHFFVSTLSDAPLARLTLYVNPRSPQKGEATKTHAEVFISGFCSVRIVSSALHSNMDVDETAYSHPIKSDEI